LLKKLICDDNKALNVAYRQPIDCRASAASPEAHRARLTALSMPSESFIDKMGNLSASRPGKGEIIG
jgi:hypothetical protein